jgi:hypothetical protein
LEEMQRENGGEDGNEDSEAQENFMNAFLNKDQSAARPRTKVTKVDLEENEPEEKEVDGTETETLEPPVPTQPAGGLRRGVSPRVVLQKEENEKRMTENLSKPMKNGKRPST